MCEESPTGILTSRASQSKAKMERNIVLQVGFLECHNRSNASKSHDAAVFSGVVEKPKRGGNFKSILCSFSALK